MKLNSFKSYWKNSFSKYNWIMERPKSVKSITMRTGISKIVPRCRY